ncbi:MAG TPA: aldo/keto reductase [Humibacter sp.]|nr:aldo/keto reductase [Humibacter sp.]
MTIPRLRMNDGRSIPQLGFGVYKVPQEHTEHAVFTAFEAGYRHIDTAALYGNEREVGRAIAASGLPREEVFVTTKVWNDRHGHDETLAAFDESLQKLGLDYLDLYLIHWPSPRQNRYVETWHALEELRADGRVRSIGVSNFTDAHLNRLLASSETVPAVNQVELHPWFQQAPLRAFDKQHGILTEAWSPLARGRVVNDRALDRIAHKHDVSPAQVVIRWHIELGNVVIPKSVTPQRIRDNADVFGFALDAEDRAAIARLDAGDRTGSHPDDVD